MLKSLLSIGSRSMNESNNSLVILMRFKVLNSKVIRRFAVQSQVTTA